MKKIASILMLACVCLLPGRSANAQIINTIVGNGFFSYGGDGGPATNAGISYIDNMTVDAAGNIYISDFNNAYIRKVNTAGIISVIAGTGIYGFSGDGGPATAAMIYGPAGIAVDGAGNIYFADRASFRIRKIDAAGIITTFAGSSFGFSGDGGPATLAQFAEIEGVSVDAAGNVYIADRGNARIRKVNTSGIITTVAGNGSGFSGDGGPATAAGLSGAYSAIADVAGNLYIADQANARIRKVNTSGIISTIAGTGTNGYTGDGGPATAAQISWAMYGISVDGSGNVYFSDGTRIRMVNSAGIISTVAGTAIYGYSGDGGPATAAELNIPWGVAVDASGRLYIADSYNARIRRISGGIITTVAGSGPCTYMGDGGAAIDAEMNSPANVIFDASGNMYISDVYNNCVRKVDAAGIITTVAGNTTAGYSGDGGPATVAEFNQVNWVTPDAAGNIYIADGSNNRVRKVNAAGIVTTIAGNGIGGYSGDGGPATAAEIFNPTALTFDAAGNLYISDGANNVIRKMTPSGVISTFAGTGGWGFSGDGGPATAATIGFPQGTFIDSIGNFYIADLGNGSVRKITPDGIIHTVIGDGSWGNSGNGGPATAAEMGDVWSVNMDSSGNLYVADAGYDQIRIVNAAGIIDSFSGSVTGYSGDGGPAIHALLNTPGGMTIRNGYMFFVDMGNCRIRFIGLHHQGPSFVGGLHQTLDLCENSPSFDLFSLLAVRDTNVGETDTWVPVTAPAHGALAAAYSTVSTSSMLIPGGLSYTPVTGYSGTDSFKVRVANTTDTIFTVVHVTVDPLVAPSVSIIGSGGVYTLMTTAGDYTAQWYINGTLTATLTSIDTFVVPVGDTGSIWVVITPLEPCYSPSTGTSNTLHIDVPTGVAGYAILTLSVYPDPFTDHLTINGAEAGDVISLEDMVGKEVMRYTCAGSSTEQVALPYMTQGVYIVRVLTPGGLQIKAMKLVRG